jgi:hypothetical protein
MTRRYEMQSYDSGNSLMQGPQFSIKPLLLTLLILSFLAVFAKFQYSTTIPSVKVDAPVDVFSSERAFNFLQQLTKEQVPHPVDSPANRIVEQRIVKTLKKMGYTPEIQGSPICLDSARGFARCTRVRNIIVNIQGSSSNKGILLAAHYDSVPAGPGGSDAGAAVGTLLETARLLSLTTQPLNSIVLLFNEGEEFGLFGAKAFMEHHPLATQLKLAINVEARGSSGKSVMFETGEDSGWLVNMYSKATPAPLSSSLFYEVYKFLPNDTDLTVFKEHGLQGLNFAHADRLPHYHTPLDNLENLDRGSLQHHGDNVWGVLKLIKDLDLTKVKSGNIVYSDILGLFIVQWSENVSLFASVLCLVLFGLLTFYYRTSLQLSLKQQIKSFLVLILILVTSALAAWVVLQTVRFFSGLGSPWHTNPIPMQLSVWFGVLLLGVIVGKWLVKTLSAKNILSSAVLLMTLLSVTSSIWLTGVSFLFLIPAMFGLVGLAVLAKLNKLTSSDNIGNGTAEISVFVINAVVTAIMFMPIAYILELMVGYSMSLAIGVMLGFIIVALLPLLTIKEGQTSHLRQLVIAITVLMIGALTWTILQPAYSAWMPQRLNINYVQNETEQAYITSGHSNKKMPQSLSASFTQPIKTMPVFPWSQWSYHTVQVKSEQQITPDFQILNIQTLENKTQIKALISTPQVNVENAQLSDVKIFIPIYTGLASIEIDSDKIQYQDEESHRNGFYEYHCRGVSCKNIEITMNFSKSNTDGKNKQRHILVMSAYPGLPKAFGKYLLARGNTSVPSQTGDQSLVYKKFKL